MWPTSLWNLGALVLVLSILLIGDWDIVKPVTSRLDWLEDFIHIPRCKFLEWFHDFYTINYDNDTNFLFPAFLS